MKQMVFPVTRREADRQGVPFSSTANKNALFPSRIRELRERKEVSQAVLAKALGVSKSTIGLWETGDTLPDAKSLHDMADYFCVSADWLLDLSPVKSTNVDVKEISEKTGLSEAIASLLLDCDAHQISGFNQVIGASHFFNICTLLIEYMSCVDSVSAAKELEYVNYAEHGGINTERSSSALKMARYKRLELVDYLTNILVSYSAQHGINDRAYGTD